MYREPDHPIDWAPFRLCPTLPMELARAASFWTSRCGKRINSEDLVDLEQLAASL